MRTPSRRTPGLAALASIATLFALALPATAATKVKIEAALATLSSP